MSKTIFILAENSIEARQYAEAHSLARNQWVYLKQPEQLYGITNPKIIRTKRSGNRVDIINLEREIAMRRRVNE